MHDLMLFHSNIHEHTNNKTLYFVYDMDMSVSIRPPLSLAHVIFAETEK